MKAIIIEDETVAAQALASLLNEVAPDIEIIANMQSIDETVEWFQTSSAPDVAFMDIHLADGSAFSVFEKVTVSCPVIFTTAYDEYALKAFEVNSIDYLLKPIVKKDLARAVNKFRNYSFGGDRYNDMIIKMISDIKQTKDSYKTSFLVSHKDKLIPLPTRDIAYIGIFSQVVKAVTFDNQTFTLDRVLDELMLQLPPHDFFRANRQYIVSRKAVKDISIWFGGKLSANLTIPTPERIIVSKARAGEFKRWLTG